MFFHFVTFFVIGFYKKWTTKKTGIFWKKRASFEKIGQMPEIALLVTDYNERLTIVNDTQYDEY